MAVYYTPVNAYTQSVVEHLKYRYAVDRSNETLRGTPVVIQFIGCATQPDVLSNANALFGKAKEFCKKLSNSTNSGSFSGRDDCFVPVLGGWMSGIESDYCFDRCNHFQRYLHRR
jgi:hypothetical protein